jgi:ATP-binding cassette, subfamily B, multidrug efflux pump
MSQPDHAQIRGRGGPSRHGSVATEKPKNIRNVIWRLLKYLGKEKRWMLLVVALLLVNIAANLTGSYLLRPIINNYIIPHDISGLIKMVAVLLLIYLIGTMATVYQNRLMINVAQKIVNNIRKDLFSKIQTLPLRFFDGHSHGELMSRFTNDVDNISDSLNTSITQLISSVLTLSGISIMMLYISPLLTLVTMIVLPMMLWIASRIIKKSRNFFISQLKALGAVNGYVEEMISGQKIVKVFCYEEHSAKEFEQLNENLRNKATKAQLYSGMMMPVIQNLGTINFALTATIGGLLAVLRGLDIGGLAAFLQYSRQFGRPVTEISNQYNNMQGALAGAERIFEILDQTPEKADVPDAESLVRVKGDVVFKDVTFGYSPDKEVLKHISLEVSAGEKIALVGSTGAGKTTIMNMLPRFYDIQSGTITIDGVDIRNIKRQDLRRQLGMVLQDTHLFTGTVMENIRYGCLSASDEEVIAAAVLAGAHSFISRLPHGYKTILDNDGANLSQGQCQLLNIARAAVAKPAILILDEATSSIDTRTEQLIQLGIDRLMEGRTSFVIAHRLSTVKNANEILVLENGEIIERGNHDALLQKRGKYYELYTGQFD